MKKGKLIVIDGADGSGKATQVTLLIKNLKKAGYKVKVEDFPQYGKFSAKAAEDYLNGLYGSSAELGPYIPSTFYAIDRFAASGRIRDNLKKGCIVVSNRYVVASMGHQGGKIQNKEKRDKYFKWLFDLEYNFYGIPRPDLNIILNMPAKVAQKLVDRKARRSYTNKKRDLHEADLSHLKAAERTYLEISKKFKYSLVQCYEHGKILVQVKGGGVQRNQIATLKGDVDREKADGGLF